MTSRINYEASKKPGRGHQKKKFLLRYRAYRATEPNPHYRKLRRHASQCIEHTFSAFPSAQIDKCGNYDRRGRTEIPTLQERELIAADFFLQRQFQNQQTRKVLPQQQHQQFHNASEMHHASNSTISSEMYSKRSTSTCTSSKMRGHNTNAREPRA